MRADPQGSRYSVLDEIVREDMMEEAVKTEFLGASKIENSAPGLVKEVRIEIGEAAQLHVNLLL